MQYANDVWAVEFNSIEWGFLLGKLVKQNNLGTDDLVIGMNPETNFTVFMFKRDKVTAEQISKLTGIPAEGIIKHGRVKLWPADERTDLPKPTVQYVGEA